MPAAKAIANRISCKRRCQHERNVVELLKRRLRKDAVEQAWQRDIDEKKMQPGEPGFRDLLHPAAGIAEEDQAEIRQRQIEDVDHRCWKPLVSLPIRHIGGGQSCPRERLGAGRGIL
jgi:hypothetical protein